MSDPLVYLWFTYLEEGCTLGPPQAVGMVSYSTPQIFTVPWLTERLCAGGAREMQKGKAPPGRGASGAPAWGRPKTCPPSSRMQKNSLSSSALGPGLSPETGSQLCQIWTRQCIEGVTYRNGIEFSLQVLVGLASVCVHCWWHTQVRILILYPSLPCLWISQDHPHTHRPFSSTVSRGHARFWNRQTPASFVCCFTWRGGFPGGSDGKASACNAGRPRLGPWVGEVPWRRKWQPTPVL